MVRNPLSVLAEVTFGAALGAALGLLPRRGALVTTGAADARDAGHEAWDVLKTMSLLQVRPLAPGVLVQWYHLSHQSNHRSSVTWQY